MLVIERGDQTYVRRLQHAVAKHVSGHVADAADREVLRLDVHAHLAEVPLDAFPGAARRDRHLFVVVAGRAAGSKCIAEPKRVFLRDCVGDVRKCGGALVGRDDQIGVVLVVPHDHPGRNDFFIDDIVGDIQQPADQRLIAGDHFGLLRLALGGQALHDEAALGADRDDDRILDLLRLHQPQNFGAEILTPIRPANAAASHVTHAQMHALHARREHEYFEQRLRQRQFAQLLALDLEGQIFLELARRIGLVGVGPHRGGERIPQGPQDSILVRTRDFLERGRECRGPAARAIGSGPPPTVADRAAR